MESGTGHSMAARRLRVCVAVQYARYRPDWRELLLQGRVGEHVGSGRADAVLGAMVRRRKMACWAFVRDLSNCGGLRSAMDFSRRCPPAQECDSLPQSDEMC